jgi:hypothetical protein
MPAHQPHPGPVCYEQSKLLKDFGYKHFILMVGITGNALTVVDQLHSLSSLLP